jgi:uncharacterized protein
LQAPYTSLPNTASTLQLPQRPAKPRRSLQFARFVAAIVWFFCAKLLSESAAHGLSQRFDLTDYTPLLQSLFFLFLIYLGLAFLKTLERSKSPLRPAIGLASRPTARTEWATGAAIGWGLAIATILPMALAGAIRVYFWTTPHMYLLLAVSVLTLLINTLAHALGIFGYPLRSLIAAIGPVRATTLIALLAAIHAILNPAALQWGIGTTMTVAILAAILECLCWIRTHAIWLLWGLHFAWAGATAALFGLPLGGNTAMTTVIETHANGPVWLTGGNYGPGAAILTIVFILAAIAVLVRATGDFAWDYTRPPIIAAGYDVTIAPPAAHAAMEQEAASRPTPLVQILPTTPQTFSVQVSRDDKLD